jgi:hypothetical protein
MQKVNLSLLAQCLNTIKTSKNDAHIESAKTRLEQEIAKLPSGSGLDRGVSLDSSSKPERLVFLAPFHHMDANGYYCGWTDYKIVLKPSFLFFGIDIRITGKDKNYVKDYLYDLFSEVFSLDGN